MLVRLGQRLSERGTLAWWVAVVAYICIQGFLHFQIAQGRTQPTELDDTFTYTWQASRLDVCLQSCRALETLGPILQTPSDDVELNNGRVDGISRLLSVYAPLEEGLLLAIQRITGMEWGAAYFVFVAIGVVLQAVGIGLLLRSLWGEWPAALGLIIAAFTLYRGQGMIYVAPSNMTLTLAMIVWAYLIKEGRDAWRVLMIGVCLLVISHPIGRLYALVALALYLTAGHWRLTRREWGVSVVVLAIIGSYWLFARFSIAPPIDVALPYVNPAFPTYFDVVYFQLLDALNKIDQSIQGFTPLPYVFLDAGFLVGAFSLMPGSTRQRRTAWIFFALTVGMLVSAAFTSLVAYPNEGNRRVIIILQIALAGGLGLLMTWSLGRLSVLLTQRLRFRNRRQLVELFLVTMVVVVSCFNWVLIIDNENNRRNDAIELLTSAQNYDVKREDLESLQNQSEITILYTNEVAMLYGLSNGLHRFGAIYLPILDTPPDLAGVDYILGLQMDAVSDPLQDLKALFPDNFIQENFVLVEGSQSDLRLYVRRSLPPLPVSIEHNE